MQLLSKKRIKFKEANVQPFFTFVQEQCPWFPEEGIVNLNTWEKVGKQIKTCYSQHGPEKVPTDVFSLWNIIRDALDPAPDSEKVHVKEESEEKEVHVREESEEKKAIPSYQQLNERLATMTANEHVKDTDEKKDQLSPQDEEDLEEMAAGYHSGEDWSFLAKDAPKSLRETSPIRPSAPRSLTEISPITPSAPMSLRETSPIRPSVRFKYETGRGSPEQERKNRECFGPHLPLPPYRGEGPPLELPWRRVLSSPEDEFDPHLEACFPVVFQKRGGEEVPFWECLPMKLFKELKQACALYGATAPYTLTLLEALAVRCLTPHDWKTIDNLKQGRNNIVKEKLVGIGDYATLRDQMDLDKETLEQVSACALGAWRLLSQEKESTSSFSNIKQRPEEPYEDFVS